MSPTPPLPPLVDAIACAEQACRALEQACAGAIDAVLAARSARVHDASRFVMDTWHVANATARILAQAAEYEPRTVAMMAGACRQIARQCAAACDDAGDAPMIAACARACERAATACNELLDRLWGSLRDDAPVRDRTAAA